MASSDAEIFGFLRTDVLETLIRSRSSIDDAFGSLAEDEIRRNFRFVLENMQKYIAAPSALQLQGSVSQWTAMLLGLGLSPRSILRAVVSLGDLVVQIARQKLEPSAGTNLFIREVVRLNFNAARAVVAIFNDELEAQRE